MAVPVPWACCAVLAAATAVVYTQRHSPQGECWRGGGRWGEGGRVFPADPLPELRMNLPWQSCMHSPESHTLAHAGIITHEHPEGRELYDTDVQGDPLMLYHRHGPPVPPG